MNGEQLQQWFKSYNLSSGDYLRKPLIMGVLNITPDSFSDGGKYLDLDAAHTQARLLINQGVDIIDIGGESTRPGASPVTSDEELARVIPIIERIKSCDDVCVSIDTHKALVMRAAVAAGADMINDVCALSGDGSIRAATELDVPVCLMHMRGNPETMQQELDESIDVIDEINQFFQQRIQACESAGILRQRLILDPGFGFGKTVNQNLLLIKQIRAFHQHQLPLSLGVSRKSTLGVILQKPVNERMPGGLAAAVFAALQGVALIRTHDVDETQQALTLLDAIMSITGYQEKD